VATINETCYQCHAEKRGPNIFEHAPVRENCASCHDVHGSNHAKLLKMKSPQLCQQCHSFSRHPGDIYDGSKLGSGTAGSAAQQMAGKGCVSCHSRIHGSNHPSGVMFLR
jgi:DmsE family decaheme c-type cytochrome